MASLLTILSLPTVIVAAPRDPYADCRAQLAAHPDDYDAAYCFYQQVVDGRPREEAARVFDELIAAHPANHWLPLVYGHIYRTRDAARAERLYRQAAEAFAATGRGDGELQARSGLRDLLAPLGRIADANREVERVVELGNAASDPLVKARAWSLQALHVQGTGGDIGFAYRLLKQAEAVVFPDGPYRLQRGTLNALGNAASRSGRLDEAVAAFQRLDALAGAAGDAQTQATARYNAFNTTAMRENALPGPDARARLLPLVEGALASGRVANNQLVMMRSHSALAELLARAPAGRDEALRHARACQELAVAVAQPYDEAVCSWIEAALMHEENPRLARVLEARAVAATTRANNPRTTAFSAGRQMRLGWLTRPRDEAVAMSLAALDAIETLRALQEDVDSSADLFSTWTHDYYWLSGRLLQDERAGDVPLAFAITERMRSRALLDAIGRSRVPPDPKHPAVTGHRAALDDIARVQRALMNPALAADQRRAPLQELEGLERRAEESRRQLSLAFPAAATNVTTLATRLATLSAVQSQLARDEALLSYQVGLWETYEGDFGGGAWLLVITRDRVRTFRLPDRTTLSDRVPVFAGLLATDRGSTGGAGSVGGTRGRDRPAAERLFQDLVAPAVDWLPPEVTRLVVVPDAALNRLPFEALRSPKDERPLGARYQLVVVPSATLWLHWRTSPLREPLRGNGRVLVLADPEIEGGGGAAAVRSAPLLQGLRLGRLPYAREEGRAIARHVGGVDTMLGAAASERMLKEASLGRYSILHLAAHAVADTANPERSAVVLTPGDGREDGLLQAREISSLDLSGRIVVLSACYTADGVVVSGEGVLSLARAFFAAGAHAVIGSRWPLRDADAAELFDVFYDHLARGASLAEALQAAQQDARAAGRPPATWAALTLLGNGDLRPLANAPPPAFAWFGPLALALGIAAVGLVVVTLRVRSAVVRRGRL